MYYYSSRYKYFNLNVACNLLFLNIYSREIKCRVHFVRDIFIMMDLLIHTNLI